MKIRVALLLGLSLFAAALCRGEIGIGDSRDEVLRQVGKPTSIASRGNREIFLYPKGSRVEFSDGKVVDVKGPLPTAVVPVAPTVPPPAPETKATSPAGTAQPAPKSLPPKKESAPKPIADTEFNPAAASEELARHVEKMDTAWGAAPQRSEVHSPLDSLPEFFTGLLMRFTFTVVALKLAFKYWEMDAFWTGVFIIAGIDLVLHAVLELLGPSTHGFTTMAGVENGIPGLVLIYTINRFCFNKRIQNAVITAAAVKVVVTLLYVFAGIAALNMIYG